MDDEVQSVIRDCLSALPRKGLPNTQEGIAVLTGFSVDMTKRNLKATTADKLNPRFLRRLAESAGLSVAEQFRRVGWLPGREVPERILLELSREIGPAARRLAEAAPYFERMARPASPAHVAAAEVLHSDPRISGRFDIRLRQFVSGTRHRAVTSNVAHITLSEGHEPLPLDEALTMADDAGLSWLPDDTDLRENPAYWSIRLELMARTHPVLHNGQEYSWQGGPRHRTWRLAVDGAAWPAQLLVQDAIGGRQGPLGHDPVTLRRENTLVFIGGRHGLGLAAPILAEALGRQYVLIREMITISESALVRDSDGRQDRTEAWAEAARMIEHRSSDPWGAVLLVRPAVFDGPKGSRALSLLRETSAQVIYARPPDAYLDWWTQRSAGLYNPEDETPIRRGKRTKVLYDKVEEVLKSRPNRANDLRILVPEPDRELPAHTPEIPGEVMDWSVRVAWKAARRLCRDIGDLRPGLLRDWQERLGEDPYAI
jgi:hypothetical protein